MSTRLVAIAAAALVAVAACSPAEKVVEPIGANDLAAAVSERLDEELNAPFAINCPEPLPAEVGASVTCEITSLAASADDVIVTATVTSVDSETGVVEFDIDAVPATEPTEDEATEDATDEATSTQESSDS